MSLLHPFHEFPKFLHHASLPPVVANDSGTEAEARSKGYTEEFIGHEYPKMVHVEVADAKAQGEGAAHGFTYAGPADAPFPHTASRTFKSAEEENAAKNGGAVDPALAEKAAEVPTGEPAA